MLRFQPGVVISYWNPRLADVFDYACTWGLLRHILVDINSIDDKTHGVGSLHHWGLAVDLDTDGDRFADLESLHGFLARYLPLEYDVLLEKDHVHVEWDNKRSRAKIAPPRPAPTPA